MATDSEEVVREGLSSVTKGTLFLLVATLTLVGVTFVSRVVVVRSISLTDFSAYSFDLTLASVLIAIGSIGLPNSVARNLPYAASDEERRTIIRGSLWIGSIAALAFSVALFLFAKPIGDSLGSSEIGIGLQYFPIAVGTTIVATLIASIFQGYEDVTPNALFIQIVNPVVFLAFLAIGIVLPPVGVSYTDVLFAYALASAVTLGCLVLYLVVRLPKKIRPGPRAPDALPRFLRFTAPLFVVTVATAVSGNGDTLILGIFDHPVVGTYSASLTLARLLPIGVTAAAYIFLPVASKFLRKNEIGSIATTYTTVTKWLILVSLPLFLLFAFVPGGSLSFVYGPQYGSIVLPLQIVTSAAFVTTLLGPAPTTQVAFGETRLLATNAIVAGLVDVGVAFALVPTYGYVGAAAAWGVSTVVFNGVSAVQLGTRTGVHPFHMHFIVPLVATAVPVAAVFYFLHPTLPWWSLPGIGFGIAGLFVTLVVLTKSVDEGDRLLLEAVERMIRRPLPFVRRLGRYALRSRRA